MTAPSTGTYSNAYGYYYYYYYYYHHYYYYSYSRTINASHPAPLNTYTTRDTVTPWL